MGLLILNETGSNVKPEQWCTSWWHQFNVLLLRGLRERRHETFNRLRIFQVLTVAILSGLLWWRTPTSHIQDRVRLIKTCILHDSYLLNSEKVFVLRDIGLLHIRVLPMTGN